MLTIPQLLKKHVNKIHNIEKVFDYSFKDKTLILRAITSANMNYVDEYGKRFDYEALEFLGDRLVNLLAIQYKFKLNDSPTWLHNRVGLGVANQHLTNVSNTLGLKKCIIFPDDLEMVPKVQADVMEAIFGAIYEDCGHHMPILEAAWARMHLLGHLTKRANGMSLNQLLQSFKLRQPKIRIKKMSLNFSGVLELTQLNLTLKFANPSRKEVTTELKQNLQRELQVLWLLNQLEKKQAT